MNTFNHYDIIDCNELINRDKSSINMWMFGIAGSFCFGCKGEGNITRSRHRSMENTLSHISERSIM